MYIIAALMVISPIPGKLDKMLTHLKNCQKISAETRNRSIAEFRADKENIPSTKSSIPEIAPNFSHSTAAASSSTLLRPLKQAKTGSSFGDATATVTDWAVGRQQEFNEDLLKLFVSCGFAWNAASNPQLGLFIEKYIPGARVPDRRALAGQILDGEVAKVEARTKERIQGKVATGQCDGWKNVAKTSVVTSMITVEHEVKLMLHYLMLRTHPWHSSSPIL
jgi:hypothetical protein